MLSKILQTTQQNFIIVSWYYNTLQFFFNKLGIKTYSLREICRFVCKNISVLLFHHHNEKASLLAKKAARTSSFYGIGMSTYKKKDSKIGRSSLEHLSGEIFLVWDIPWYTSKPFNQLRAKVVLELKKSTLTNPHSFYDRILSLWQRIATANSGQTFGERLHRRSRDILCEMITGIAVYWSS